MNRSFDYIVGLGSGDWSRDLAPVHKVAARLRTGTVWAKRRLGEMKTDPVGVGASPRG